MKSSENAPYKGICSATDTEIFLPNRPLCIWCENSKFQSPKTPGPIYILIFLSSDLVFPQRYRTVLNTLADSQITPSIPPRYNLVRIVAHIDEHRISF